MRNATRWKSSLATVALSAALLFSVIPAYADGGGSTSDPSSATAQTDAAYALSGSIRAELKTVSISKTDTGTQLAAVVRLRNDGGTQSRVPDYELRATTADGVEYTLAASSANARSLLGKESADLTYLVTVDRQDGIVWTGLKFVEVDEYVYPKLETTLLTIPLSRVWNATTADFDQPVEPSAWGTPFTLPGTDAPVVYTPVGYEENNGPDGHAYVVTVLAENKGTASETVGSFRLDGKADGKSYAGQRIEQNPVALAAGEQKYIHFAIPTDAGVSLSSLLVMTTESFAGAGQTVVTFDAGALAIAVPAARSEPVGTNESYEVGAPIAVDPLNKLIDANTEVSLMELHMHGNEGEGYKSAIAKFRLRNTGSSTVTLPAFGAEMIGSDGNAYAGTRQAQTSATLMPNLSYVVSYSFMVPATETGERVAIRLLDSQTTAPYSSTIASIGTAVQQEGDDETLAFYPFSLKINSWAVNSSYNAATGYSYRMKLDLDLQRVEDVVVDANFSKLKIELTDTLGRVIGSQTTPFTGTNKLISGQQDITFANLYTDTFQFPLVINLYETIDTPNGEASRLVKTLKQ